MRGAFGRNDFWGREEFVQARSKHAFAAPQETPCSFPRRAIRYLSESLEHQNLCSILHDQWREVRQRCLVANSAVGLAADERKVRNIVRLSWRVAVLQLRLRKNVMKLQLVMRARMLQRDIEVRTPILLPAVPVRRNPATVVIPNSTLGIRLRIF